MRRASGFLLLLIAFTLLGAIFALPRIAQDPAYHALADGRTLLGLPNFLNVASNVAFLLVGAAGLLSPRARRGGGATLSWTVFFAGVACVAVGSAYYHWAPSDATLVWDRLPMTIAFMALFAAIVSEHAAPRLERILLATALAAGIASVAWWAYTDDLRAYIVVQATPLLAVLLVLAAFTAPHTHRNHLVYALACYVLAKIFELQDTPVFEMTSGMVSGHTLKHLAAALSAFFIYRMLRERQPINAGAHVPG